MHDLRFTAGYPSDWVSLALMVAGAVLVDHLLAVCLCLNSIRDGVCVCQQANKKPRHALTEKHDGARFAVTAERRSARGITVASYIYSLPHLAISESLSVPQ